MAEFLGKVHLFTCKAYEMEAMHTCGLGCLIPVHVIIKDPSTKEFHDGLGFGLDISLEKRLV